VVLVAIEARYTHPIQVVETEETRDRIKAIADREKISQAQVIRELVAAGLADREALSLSGDKTKDA
jgi:predicted DNA-binding protein